MPTADTSSATASNPFAAQIVSDADSIADLIDVGALHESARKSLIKARSRAQAGRSHVTVIIGDEGAGKSHLLWWLRRQNASSTGLCISISALPDLAQPFRHALKQLVAALCRKTGDDAQGIFERPIDRLIWEALYAQTADLLDAARIGMYQCPAALLKVVGPLVSDGGRRRELADFVAMAQPVWAQVEPGLRAYLLSLPTEMSIDPAARAVLVQYPYADRRALCTAWLAGEELSAKDRERISAKQMINNESAAKYVVCALCRMLTAQPGQTSALTVIYDQTDVVAQQWGQAGMQSIAEVISTLSTQGGAPLQILSCRPAVWRMLLDKSPRPGPGQLKQVDDTLELEKPTVQHLKEIAAARAGKSSALTAQDLDPTSWPKEVATPRAALSHLSMMWLARTDPQSKQAVPIPASDAPTAKGLPSGPVKPQTGARNAPSKPAVAVPSAKIVTASAGVKAMSAKPQTGPIKAPSKAEVAATKAALAPTPPVGVAKVEPSAASPSVTWMAMVSDDELPKIASGEQDRTEIGRVMEPTPKPITRPLSKPIAKPASKPIAKPVTAPQPQPQPKPVEIIEPPAPSAISPSVSWIAMASDEDPLAQALAAIDKKDAAAAKPRMTKDKMRTIGAPQSSELSPDQVMAAFGKRDRVEEWQLMQELDVSQQVLGEVLSILEDLGKVRILPLGDGQRTVAKL